MVKVNSKSQNGRSMVEMLGVLAIVGVLSVGGVYGYGVAMKKHKANEALHKASMLATTVSAYAMSNDGNLPSSIADFANWGYDTSVTDDGTQFKLTMKGVGYDVCKQMESSMGGMVRNVTCVEGSDDAVITYYKNLATTSEEGEKSPTGSNGGGSGGDTKPTCPTGTSTEGAGGYATTLADGGMCRCETSGTVYKDGTCESKGDDNTCSSYADCDKGQYCYFEPDDCTRYPSASGICKPVSDCGLYNIDINDGKKYTASAVSFQTNWWAAQDICDSLGMRMVSFADLGCEEDYKNKEECPTTDTVAKLITGGLFTDKFFWITDMDDENDPDACHRWNVRYGDGYNPASTTRPWWEDDSFLCVSP